MVFAILTTTTVIATGTVEIVVQTLTIVAKLAKFLVQTRTTSPSAASAPVTTLDRFTSVGHHTAWNWKATLDAIVLDVCAI